MKKSDFKTAGPAINVQMDLPPYGADGIESKYNGRALSLALKVSDHCN